MRRSLPPRPGRSPRSGATSAARKKSETRADPRSGWSTGPLESRGRAATAGLDALDRADRAMPAPPPRPERESRARPRWCRASRQVGRGACPPHPNRMSRCPARPRALRGRLPCSRTAARRRQNPCDAPGWKVVHGLIYHETCRLAPDHASADRPVELSDRARREIGEDRELDAAVEAPGHAEGAPVPHLAAGRLPCAVAEPGHDLPRSDRQQRPHALQPAPRLVAVELAPIELRSLVCRRRVRIGDSIAGRRIPELGKPRELAAPAVPDSGREIVLEVTEELERRPRAPFLAHEQHGDVER